MITALLNMNTYMKLKAHHVFCKQKISKTACLLTTLVFMLNTVTGSSSSASSSSSSSSRHSNGLSKDKEHSDMYPYCGGIKYYPKKAIKWPNIKDASSRIANSKKSAMRYPWVMLVQRKTKHDIDKDGNDVLELTCSGTVLTER